jgi:hypothetical protein
MIKCKTLLPEKHYLIDFKYFKIIMLVKRVEKVGEEEFFHGKILHITPQKSQSLMKIGAEITVHLKAINYKYAPILLENDDLNMIDIIL